MEQEIERIAAYEQVPDLVSLLQMLHLVLVKRKRCNRNDVNSVLDMAYLSLVVIGLVSLNSNGHIHNIGPLNAFIICLP